MGSLQLYCLLRTSLLMHANVKIAKGNLTSSIIKHRLTFGTCSSVDVGACKVKVVEIMGGPAYFEAVGTVTARARVVLGSEEERSVRARGRQAGRRVSNGGGYSGAWSRADDACVGRSKDDVGSGGGVVDDGGGGRVLLRKEEEEDEEEEKGGGGGGGEGGKDIKEI
uniref:Uncharacterized protein n=1 Tax=Vespula pensylvanica TaxID=30213 RepID=A0A834UHQ3_VESPE|nr:hypothetical protein H0235_001760 [Vespula pensylvanica]